MPTVHEVAVPSTGIWRVGRQPDPLETSQPPTGAQMSDHRAGNRFDSFVGNYAVLYFATDPTTCFAETLARLRPRPRLAQLVNEEWGQMGFMNPGSVPREWRNDRRLTRVTLRADERFADVDHPDTIVALEQLLAPTLSILGTGELDVSDIRGKDRRITRLISQAIWSVKDDDGYSIYSGIRYASRVNGQECWAVFGDVPLSREETKIIDKNNPHLRAVAEQNNLTIH